MNNNKTDFLVTKAILGTEQEFPQGNPNILIDAPPSEHDDIAARLTALESTLDTRFASNHVNSASNLTKELNRFPISSVESQAQCNTDLSNFIRKGVAFGQDSGAFAVNASSILVGKSKYSPLARLCNHFETNSDVFDDIFVANDIGEITGQNVRLIPETHTFTLNSRALRNPHINVHELLTEQALRVISKKQQDAILVGANGFESLFHTRTPLQSVERTIDALWAFAHRLAAEYSEDAVWIMSKTEHQLLLAACSADAVYRKQFAEGKLFGKSIVVLDYPDGCAEECIVYGDLKLAYAVVESTEVPMQRDEFSAKPNVEFTLTRHSGGKITNANAMVCCKMTRAMDAE